MTDCRAVGGERSWRKSQLGNFTVKAESPDFYSQPWLVERRKLASVLNERENYPPRLLCCASRSDLLARLPLIIFPTAPPTLYRETLRR